MLSNAQLIQDYAKTLRKDIKAMKMIGELSEDNYELLRLRLQHISHLVEPYIQAEQQEPGLSGHELKAFEAQKFNDTLGEDPKH